MDNQSYEGHDLEAMAEMPRYHDWINGYFEPYVKGRGVEFGAGLGLMSQLLRAKLSHFDLVEPSPSHAARLANRFQNAADITVFPESLESYLGRQDDNSVNTLILTNVLEHIEDDAMAVEGFHRILEVGGYLLIFVPALNFLFSDLDRRLGHFRRYHKMDLASLVEGAGFQVHLIHYFDILGVLPWWLVYTLTGKTKLDPKMSALYDFIGVPVTRGFDKLVTPPFGKNLILVAQK